MAEPSYIYFNKSLQQCRSIGARGGQTFGRNQRARRARLTTPPEAVPVRAALSETTAKAISVLDAQFPWLALQKIAGVPDARLRFSARDCADGEAV